MKSLTTWTTTIMYLRAVSEEEIKKGASKIKEHAKNAYLFRDMDNLLILKDKRRTSDTNLTFIKKL
jgi:hypothetical protein